MFNIKINNQIIEEKSMNKGQFNKNLEDNLNYLKLIIQHKNSIKGLLVISSHKLNHLMQDNKNNLSNRLKNNSNNPLTLKQISKK